MPIITPYIVTRFTRSSPIPPPFNGGFNEGNENKLEGYYGYEYYGDVYIKLRDEFNNPVDGNNLIVKYQESFDGIADPEREVSIPGSIATIQYNILLQRSVYHNTQPYEAVILGTTLPGSGTYTPPHVCDARINTVKIQKLAGAGNSGGGQISIQASSSFGPVQYKLNDGAYQDSPEFSNLTGGGYTAYITDAQRCTDSRIFTLEALSNLLITDPAIDAGNGNISRWSAAFNPVVFTYQRRDFSISEIYATSFAQKQLLQ